MSCITVTIIANQNYIFSHNSTNLVIFFIKEQPIGSGPPLSFCEVPGTKAKTLFVEKTSFQL